MEKEKPDWLQALESQSWQAELIASGLAIFGSLSVGPYIDFFVENMVTMYNDRVLTILNYVFLYIYAAHAIVVISFIFHLALRILWVAILGLSSVYPNGINLESDSYARHFLVSLKEEFPDISAYSMKLDDVCSVIFSILCSMFLVLISISVWLFFLIIFVELLSLILGDHVDYLMYGLFAIMMIFSFLFYIVSTGPKKESDFAQKNAYRIGQIYGKVFYLIGYTPLNYMMYILRTNLKSKTFTIGMTLITLLSVIFSGPKIVGMMDLFNYQAFHRTNDRPDKANSENYLNTVKKSMLLKPVIQSELIKDNYLHLFLPEYKRDILKLKEQCAPYQTKDEGRLAKLKSRTACMNNVYKVFVDDQPINNIQFQFKKHTHNGELGYESLFAIDTLSIGRHMLKIEVPIVHNEDSVRTSLIPFYKVN